MRTSLVDSSPSASFVGFAIDARTHSRLDGWDETRSTGRQHGEKVILVDDVATASQLGRIANDAAEPRADQRPVAEGVGAHQLAHLQRERDVGAERPVGVRRCVEGGRRAGGPNGYPPPGRLQFIHDRKEAVREARVHDEQGMDVGGDGRVVEEDGSPSLG
jgi:hypothetical protein